MTPTYKKQKRSRCQGSTLGNVVRGWNCRSISRKPCVTTFGWLIENTALHFRYVRNCQKMISLSCIFIHRMMWWCCTKHTGRRKRVVSECHFVRLNILTSVMLIWIQCHHLRKHRVTGDICGRGGLFYTRRPTSFHVKLYGTNYVGWSGKIYNIISLLRVLFIHNDGSLLQCQTCLQFPQPIQFLTPT